MRVKLIVLSLIWPVAALSQGFAGLGSDVEGFATPAPDYTFEFPQDHGPHPDFRIEWWYLTANLRGEDGTDYGLQWTLFRSALEPREAEGWESPQMWMGHAAVTTPGSHYLAERRARGGIGQAGVIADPFAAWIDDWALEGNFDALSMRVSGPDFGYEMDLTAQGPVVLHGQKGFSVKSAQGQASYYYSQPFYKIEGVLQLPDGDVTVSGSAWLDREWSSQPLGADQTGWDWFSLSFDDGTKLMAFQLRDTSGGSFSSGTWIDADGATSAIPNGAMSARPTDSKMVAGRDIPTAWRVALPGRGVDVTVQALNADAWMKTSVPYWEGPVRIDGSHAGRGYLEMTGY